LCRIARSSSRSARGRVGRTLVTAPSSCWRPAARDDRRHEARDCVRHRLGGAGVAQQGPDPPGADMGKESFEVEPDHDRRRAVREERGPYGASRFAAVRGVVHRYRATTCRSSRRCASFSRGFGAATRRTPPDLANACHR